MAYQPVDIGAAPNDGTGDPIRDAFDKCNDNFVELYAGLTGLLDFKGSTDCSANPNYPAASKGDFYLVSVAGKIGGASGIDVTAGDSYFATADNAGGNQATVGSSWTVIQGNVTYAPVNKAGDTMTGDLIVPDEAYDATNWDGNLEVPTKNAVRDKIESIVVGGGASTTQTGEMIGGFIAAPSDKSYTIALKMAHGGTITETTTKSASGTCTATFKINTTALGGTANSVSSAEQSQAHASSNTFAAGDDIVLTVSSNSSCADMSFSIKYTRTLD